MGSRGPLPKPNAIRRERVTPAGRAQRSAGSIVPLPSILTLAAPPAPPAAPRGLASPGRKAWRELWESAHWLTDVDRPAMTRLCELVDEIEVYRTALKEHGVVIAEPVVSPKGDVVGTRPAANPAVRALKDATAGLTVLANALGLSPSSRARLGLVVAQTRSLIDGSGR